MTVNFLIEACKNMRLRVLVVAMIAIVAAFTGCTSGASVTPREGSIRGKILNLTGRPVEDALVTWAYDNTRWSLTDENGSYFIEGIGFGEQSFQVEAFGYRTLQFSSSIFSGQTTDAPDQQLESKSFDYFDIEVTEVSATHAVIEWKTSDYTNGLIEYGENDVLGNTVRETSGEYLTSHSLKIPRLSPQKQYFFRIVSSRQGREAETSERGSFTTLSNLEDNTAPEAPTGVQAAINSSPNIVTVFWAPINETDLKGYKVYRGESANSAFREISSMMVARGQERYSDTSVIPGKKYYYRVTAIDQANNESGYNDTASILVPGDIATEITWTRGNSPYLVTGDISILETGRLNIDAGVEVLMADYDAFRRNDPDKIDFIVSGALVASSGNRLPVVFASNEVNPGNDAWNGLAFTKVENPANTLVNVQISDAITGLRIENSTGVYSQVEILNCQTAVKCSNNKDLSVSQILTRRCSSGIELDSNLNFTLASSTFYHPTIAVLSSNNDGLKIKGCNMLEFTDSGLISNESGGIIEFTNNLFVAPNGWAMKILAQSPLIENNSFDVPYCIQLSQGSPLIRKNVMLAERSFYSSGKTGIEYLGNATPAPIFGPNNIYGFDTGRDYVNCEATTDSTGEDLLFMKELTGDQYDYRLRQPYPATDDSWGINREDVPFQP